MSIERPKVRNLLKKRSRSSPTKKNSKKTSRGLYLSRMGRQEKYDSSYELQRFRFLDSQPSVRDWTKDHKIKIPYVLKRKRHRYNPDILVTMEDGTVFLEEIKGRVWDVLKFHYKNFAALCYCKSKGWKFRILFEKDLKIL